MKRALLPALFVMTASAAWAGSSCFSFSFGFGGYAPRWGGGYVSRPSYACARPVYYAPVRACRPAAYVRRPVRTYSYRHHYGAAAVACAPARVVCARPVAVRTVRPVYPVAVRCASPVYATPYARTTVYARGGGNYHRALRPGRGRPVRAVAYGR